MSASSGAGSPEMVWELQEKAARALPAEHVEHVGGWWLRHSTSCAWWAGTVLPHVDAEPEELARRVVGAERFYAGHGTAARFQISPRACPESLDTHLAERGYRRESPMSMQVAATTQVLEQAPRDSLRVRLDEEPTRAWFEVWNAVHGHADGDRRTEWNMLDRVQQPSAYVGAMLGGDVVAVGRAVADEGWAGVFGMATLPHARGQRAGRSALAALAEWAAAHDADRLYLQVECDNIPALRLYEGAGFGEVFRYHYRIAG
ncbi:ribosomal protein S18 acetylase RimI-like enzyme [Halopolyspora algeriensis]|uniref:Ribosomal protein S18 acetylase RimI-like enzyme n=1 Tax=Halopolyspora algeriensis TaxID=1500506 RepID=A0A368VSM2_9ACTN|nr:GNAT family N-acetyltransferase [Halopolyspora algeriensis]RCW44665.1 ribosomal protein S18 acetylase RimI-like enzyme [Halopolyspora algeriensis]TQM56026.1 ribosomal protein S18 acetylase RimI-like enzyme [Halopolyspora algeriensis]